MKYYCQYEKEAKTLRMTPMDQKPGAKQVSWFLGGMSANTDLAIRSHLQSAHIISFHKQTDEQVPCPEQYRPAPLSEQLSGSTSGLSPEPAAVEGLLAMEQSIMSPSCLVTQAWCNLKDTSVKRSFTSFSPKISLKPCRVWQRRCRFV